MHRRNGYRQLRRVAAGAAALVLLGLSASPAWADPPDAPAPPTVTRGDSQIVVSFVAPFDGNVTIDSYTASCTSGDGGTTGAVTDFTPTDPATPITVDGLDNGFTYVCTVTATNADGSATSTDSDPVVPAAVPDQPAPPTVARGDQQVTVTFSAPANNGSSISIYKAVCSDGVTPTGVFGTTSPIIVTGLTNGVTYTCTVRATNDVGNSAPSNASAPVTPAAVPDQPAQPTVTSGDQQLVVAFTAPAANGNTITSYTASCTSSTTGVFGSVTDTSPTIPATPITVTGLTDGRPYTCTVTATNGVGNSITSVASASIKPAGLPTQIPQPTVVRGNHQIIVSFTAALGNGSPITSYTATCTDGVTPVAISGAASPITVTGLTNGNSYTCTVFAHNGVGNGLPSPQSAAVVPAAVPNAPATPSVARGNAQITVSFSPPANNGSAISLYTVACTSSNGGTPGSNTGAISPIAVTSLTNGYTYTCTVKATNGAGIGPASPQSATAVPATNPDAPTIGKADSGNTTASVSYTPGGGNGSAITSFTALCVSNDGVAGTASAGATATAITVGGLTPGSIYTCSVTATNAVGTSASSAPSPAFVEGQPSRPTNAVVTPGAAPGATGPLTIKFTAPADNGSAITAYGAQCQSINGGVTGTQDGSGSPITVTGLTTGKSYNCKVFATNALGTGFPSNVSVGIVGAPAAPVILRALPIAHGLVMPFTAPANNGATIVNYRAVCTSSDGGVPTSPLQVVTPIVATNMTDGKTYSCTVTANNQRGAGAATVVAPIVVGALSLPNLANCTGSSGTVTSSPGLLYSNTRPVTFGLNETFSSCSGPYVSAARIALSFRSASAVTCQNVYNVTSGGSGTLTWTSPAGMGTSSATVRFVVTSSTGHVTKVHYYGDVTSAANVFTGNHLSGNLTLNKGLHTGASGGDCSATIPLVSFTVTAATLLVT